MIKSPAEFPVFKTKVPGVKTKFDLGDVASRKKYFQAKAGKEIKFLNDYLKKKTFVAYLLGKKNSGKGTYSKLFIEALGTKKVGHVSVGDIVRDVHKSLSDKKERKNFVNFLKLHYRGFHDLEETIGLIEGRSQISLMSTELIIALVKYEISKRPRQALFIDGFPRALDQINYSLYLRDLIGYRNDPDMLVFISLPESVIDERIKYRVVCPKCRAPRNTRLMATKHVGYDEKDRSFYLMCDNPDCKKVRMEPKEGDELGIEPIRARLAVDDEVFKKLLGVGGIPKIYLRNSLPKKNSEKFVDAYEVTPGYSYERNIKTGEIKTIEKPWTIKDDEGKEALSLLPPPVAVSLIKQMAAILKSK
jgi:adenylate kinase family enzyme